MKALVLFFPGKLFAVHATESIKREAQQKSMNLDKVRFAV